MYVVSFCRPCPYESSKYITDMIAVALNSRLNQRNIFSFTTHPGVAATNIVRDHLGFGMQKLMEVSFYVVIYCGYTVVVVRYRRRCSVFFIE